MENKIKIGIGLLIIVILIAIGVFYLQNNSKESPCDSEPGFLEAVNSKNFENCKNIEEDYCVDYCRFKIAAYSNNPTNCELIKGIKHKDLCYYHLSQSLKDVSLCSKIEQTGGISKSVCETLYYEKYGWPEK